MSRTRFALLVLLLVCKAAASQTPHLALDVELDPATRRFSAVAELDAPADYKLALHPSLTVRTINRTGFTLRDINRTGFTLRIEYAGTLPLLDQKLDHRDVLTSSLAAASPQGSFLAAGSGWYPEPRGLFTYTVRLSLPADQRGLVEGRLISETLPASATDRYIAQFEVTRPAEGINLMAGPYVVREKRIVRAGTEPLRLRTYFFRDLDGLAQGYLDDSARYIALYSKLIGHYPYDAFSVVASPLPTGLGMPTLTYIGAQVLKLPFIRATSLGHEVLHNWWGNGVYVDYARGNWSEGLTTFMADYLSKERESAQAARDTRIGWLRDFAAVPPGRHLPLTAFRSRTHGAEAAVGYGKAAMVFFMLRDLIGEEAFAHGIRLFWEANKFRVASWDEVRAAFEKSSGRSLAAFFEQWVQRAGGAKIEATDARLRTSAGRHTVTLTLSQTAPAYAIEVPVEIAAGEKREMRRVTLKRERQTVALETALPADGLRIDPDFRLWRVLAREELPPILRQWIISRAPRLLVLSGNTALHAAAVALASAFFEASPVEIDPRAIKDSAEPLLLVGTERDVDSTLQSLGLPARPALVATRGSAQVWTIAPTASTPPIAVVSARDSEAVGALARPLPHYGSQSYLAFDGATAITRGVWPALSTTLTVRP